ncbi:hypothetical protein ALC56_11445 [Trachymyrmex septentrionalis]|uniref:Uncharacterized protein n=1 Tax=Trachymyrmex septentrionalis TaxID=34720 RepID=A0A195F1J3_9HYME|nr:hypothetical protein ALC56_11445 [Trachymyrmex septentrionalis]
MIVESNGSCLPSAPAVVVMMGGDAEMAELVGLSEKPNCQSDSRAFIAKVWDRRSFGCNSGSSSYVRSRNDNGSY